MGAETSRWGSDWHEDNGMDRKRDLQELNKEDPNGYKNFIRVDAEMLWQFSLLLS